MSGNLIARYCPALSGTVQGKLFFLFVLRTFSAGRREERCLWDGVGWGGVDGGASRRPGRLSRCVMRFLLDGRHAPKFPLAFVCWLRFMSRHPVVSQRVLYCSTVRLFQRVLYCSTVRLFARRRRHARTWVVFVFFGPCLISCLCVPLYHDVLCWMILFLLVAGMHAPGLSFLFCSVRLSMSRHPP